MFKKKRKNMFVNEEIAKKVKNNIFFKGNVPDVKYNELNQSSLNNNFNNDNSEFIPKSCAVMGGILVPEVDNSKNLRIPNAVSFGPTQEMANITSVSDQQIVRSESKNPKITNFRMSQIGVDTNENDSLQDPPVIEAHTASSGGGYKNEVTHSFLRVRATVYEHNPGTDDLISQYKRKVFSFGFYPFNHQKIKSPEKEAYILEDRLSELRNDADHYSRLAMTKECNYDTIEKLFEETRQYVANNPYNLAFSNCTTFVNKILSTVGMTKMSNVFLNSGGIDSPNIAARKMDSIMNNSDYRHEGYKFKYEDYKVNIGDDPNKLYAEYRKYKTSVTHPETKLPTDELKGIYILLKEHGIDLTKKKITQEILTNATSILNRGKPYDQQITEENALIKMNDINIVFNSMVNPNEEAYTNYFNKRGIDVERTPESFEEFSIYRLGIANTEYLQFLKEGRTPFATVNNSNSVINIKNVDKTDLDGLKLSNLRNAMTNFVLPYYEKNTNRIEMILPVYQSICSLLKEFKIQNQNIGEILEEDLVEIDLDQQNILYKLLALFHTLYGIFEQDKNLNGKNIAGSWISRINTYLKRAKIRYI